MSPVPLSWLSVRSGALSASELCAGCPPASDTCAGCAAAFGIGSAFRGAGVARPQQVRRFVWLISSRCGFCLLRLRWLLPPLVPSSALCVVGGDLCRLGGWRGCILPLILCRLPAVVLSAVASAALACRFRLLSLSVLVSSALFMAIFL